MIICALSHAPNVKMDDLGLIQLKDSLLDSIDAVEGKAYNQLAAEVLMLR